MSFSCGAFLRCLLGGEVQQVTIEPDDDDGPQRFGDTQILWSRDSGDNKEFAEKAVQVCLAGPVAEMVYSGDPWHPGLVAEWVNDWRQAWDVAAALHADERKRLAFLEQVSVELHRLLQRDDVWAALAALADHLLAHETMEGEQVEEIVGQWLGDDVAALELVKLQREKGPPSLLSKDCPTQYPKMGDLGAFCASLQRQKCPLFPDDPGEIHREKF